MGQGLEKRGASRGWLAERLAGRGLVVWLALALVVLVLLGDGAAALLPERWLGACRACTMSGHRSFVDHYFVWDSLWYERIARNGYTWSDRDPGQHSIAFFPLWPLILAALNLTGLAPGVLQWVTIGLCVALAFVSIWQMSELARRVLPVGSARVATALYALYPAAIFLVHSYPTGLMNCLTLVALNAMLSGQFLRAAMLSGAATAGGPLALALGATVGAAALPSTTGAWIARAGGGVSRQVAMAMLCGFVAISGLLAFCAWQWWVYGDPAIFVHAQSGWGISPPFPVRLLLTALQLVVVPNLVQSGVALQSAWTALQVHDLVEAQRQLQGALNVAGIAVCTVGVAGCFRLQPRWLMLQGFLVLVLYAWFLGSSITGWASFRLLYITPVPFLGLAAMVQRWPAAGMCLVGFSALLLVTEEFMMSAGYLVI